jgi:hypothetical protein
MRLRECLRTFETMQCYRRRREAIHEGRTDCSPIYLSEIEGLQRYLVVEIAANEVKDGRPSAR